MKRGYTILETLFVVAVIIISFSTSIILVNIGKRIVNENNYQSTSIEIVDFINSSKRYCRENGIPGYIICDTANNSVKFICNTHLVYKFYLPKGFKIDNLNTNNGTILINSRGISGSACTIKYEDANGELHLITMRVGTSYVEIKK